MFRGLLSNRNSKRKRSGFALLIVTLSTGMLIAVLGLSLVQIHNSSMNVLRKNDKIYQAQLYALDEANLIRVMDYEAITNKPLAEVNNSGFYRKIVVENNVSSDGKYNVKNAVVSVFDDSSGSELPLASYTMNVYKKI